MDAPTIVQYQTDFGTIGEGYVAEAIVDPLTNRTQYRVVDFPVECDDPDAGTWRDAAECWKACEIGV